MMEFEDMQGVWQTQETPSQLDEATKKGIDQFERKVRRDRLMLRITLPLTCVFILGIALWHGDLLYAAGVAVNIIAMVLFLIQFRKVKRPGEAHSPEDATGEFLRQNLRLLHSYKHMARKFTPIYGGLIVLGQVIAFSSFFLDRPLLTQIALNGAYALGLSLFFALTYYLYMRTWKRKWKPLMEKLEQQIAEFS